MYHDVAVDLDQTANVICRYLGEAGVEESSLLLAGLGYVYNILLLLLLFLYCLLNIHSGASPAAGM